MASNWMELNLSREDDEFVRRYGELYRAQYVETIETVFGIAKSIDILKRRFDGSGIRGAFGDALVQYGYIARDGGPMNKAIRSFHKTLLDNEAEVRAWWAKVPDPKKRDWLSAKAICINWQRSLKPAPKKPNPLQASTSKPSVDKPAAASEDTEVATLRRQLQQERSLLQQATATVTALHDRIRELEDKFALAQLALQQATGKITIPTVEEMAARRRAVEQVEKAKRAEAKAKRIAQIPVDPTETMETLTAKLKQKDQQLKAAQTHIRKLTVLADKKVIFVDGKTLQTINAALSPLNFADDPTKYKRAEKAAQLFGSLPIRDPNKPEQAFIPKP